MTSNASSARADLDDFKRPIIGIEGDDTLDVLAEMPTSIDELVEGSALEDCDVTIMGFRFEVGGEEVARDDGTSFTSQDRLTVQVRVDDIDGISDRKIWYPLPGRDAAGKRRPVNSGSKLGLFTASLAAFGIHSGAGAVFPFGAATGGWKNLLGLSYHSKLMAYPGLRRNSTIEADVATAVYGFDNEIRRANGLEPVEGIEFPSPEEAGVVPA